MSKVLYVLTGVRVSDNGTVYDADCPTFTMQNREDMPMEDIGELYERADVLVWWIYYHEGGSEPFELYPARSGFYDDESVLWACQRGKLMRAKAIAAALAYDENEVAEGVSNVQ